MWSNEEGVVVGQLVEQTTDQIQIKTLGGTITIPPNDGTTEEITEEQYHILLNESTKPKEEEIVVTSKSGSKMEQCVHIYNQMIGQQRKDVINKFMSELQISKPHAGTYYQTIKTKLSK
ncbi:MAG: hypothetical protein ACXW2E_00770 [Nitrososphaeraceae archaeon]